jgi:hypothetical protein
VLRIRIRDQGFGAFLPWDPDTGWKNIWIQDPNKHPGSYFQGLNNHFLAKKSLNSLFRIRIRDTGSGALDPGWDGKIRIRNNDFNNKNLGGRMRISKVLCHKMNTYVEVLVLLSLT